MAEQGLPTRTVERALAEVIAFLDPGGSPGPGLWTSPEVADYLRWAHTTDSSWHRARTRLFGPPQFGSQDRKAWLGRLARANIVGVEAHSADEWDATVTMPMDTRAALLDAIDTERAQRAARAAASALESAWREADRYATAEWGGPVSEETEQLLLTNVRALESAAGRHLFLPEPHSLLHWVGSYLRESPRHTATDLAAHHAEVAERCERLLGAEHPSTVRVRAESPDS